MIPGVRRSGPVAALEDSLRADPTITMAMACELSGVECAPFLNRGLGPCMEELIRRNAANFAGAYYNCAQCKVRPDALWSDEQRHVEEEVRAGGTVYHAVRDFWAPWWSSVDRRETWRFLPAQVHSCVEDSIRAGQRANKAMDGCWAIGCGVRDAQAASFPWILVASIAAGVFLFGKGAGA